MDLAKAIALCILFEGYREQPYLCPAGVPTIGYGTTRYPSGRRVQMTDPGCSPLSAKVYLKHELDGCAESVKRLCPGVYAEALLTGNWNRFNALADFVYNLGAGRLQTSTLRRVVNAQDWPAAERELMRWVRGGGRILPGLVKRRTAEVALLRCK